MTTYDVYDIITTNIIKNPNQEEMEILLEFIQDLQNLDVSMAGPFNEKETDRLRFFLDIHSTYILNKYAMKQIDISRSKLDIEKTSKKIYDYVKLKSSKFNNMTSRKN